MQIWGEAEELVLFSLKMWKKLRGDLLAVFCNLMVSYRVDTGKPAWRYTAKAQETKLCNRQQTEAATKEIPDENFTDQVCSIMRAQRSCKFCIFDVRNI